MKRIHVLSQLITGFHNTVTRCELQPIYNRAARNALSSDVSAVAAIRALNDSGSSTAPIRLRVAMEVIASVRTGENDELPFNRALCKALRQVVGALMRKQHELLIEEFVRRGLPVPTDKNNAWMIDLLATATYESRCIKRAPAKNEQSRHLWRTLEAALTFGGYDPTSFQRESNESIFAAIATGATTHGALLQECRVIHAERASDRLDLQPSADHTVPELKTLKRQLVAVVTPSMQKPKTIGRGLQALADISVAA